MSPQLVELYGIVGLDFVIIGAEVESIDMGRMEDLIRAADASDTVPIVKIRRPDPNLVGEAMNMGAPFVMVPHVLDRKMLDHLVRASKFEPEGLRGECPIARYNGYGVKDLAKSHAMANAANAIIPIIEDAEALDHLDEMMECDDVDIFEIGPYDLSRSLDETGQGFSGAKTMAAIEKVCAAAQRHDKAVLMPFWHLPSATSYKALLEHQMNELVARGATCLYELETAFLGLHLSRMSLLRRARAVEETPAIVAPTIAARMPVRGKAKKAKPKPTNAKASKRAY